MALGMVLVVWPGPGALGLMWIIGAYALVAGLLLIAFGVRLWNWQRLAAPWPADRQITRPGVAAQVVFQAGRDLR